MTNSLKQKLVIGVTGGIGSGKSALTREFELLGITVVDADVVARQVVAVDSPVLNQIKDQFGVDILLDDGELNRVKLRELIFNDDQKKQALNRIMHPAIRDELISQLTMANSPYVILSAPLLLENNLDKFTDKVVVVDVSVATQIERAAKRDDVSQQQIKAIIASQIDRDSRTKQADYLVSNEGDIAQLVEKAKQLNAEFLRLSADMFINVAK